MWQRTPGTLWPPLGAAALLLEDTEVAGEPGRDNEQLHLKLEGVG